MSKADKAAKKEAKPKRIKVSIPIFINADDGCARVTVCKTEEDADRAAAQNLKNGGQSLESEVQTLEIVVDEEGNLIRGFEKIDTDEEE